MKQIEHINKNQENVLEVFAQEFLDYFDSVSSQACSKFTNSLYLEFNKNLLLGGKVYEKNNTIKNDEELQQEMLSSFLIMVWFSLQLKYKDTTKQLKYKDITEYDFFRAYTKKLCSEPNFFEEEIQSIINKFVNHYEKLKQKELRHIITQELISHVSLILQWDIKFWNNQKNMDPLNNIEKLKKLKKQELGHIISQNIKSHISRKAINILQWDINFLNKKQNLVSLIDLDSFPQGILDIYNSWVIDNSDFLSTVDVITSWKYQLSTKDMFVFLHRKNKFLPDYNKYLSWKLENMSDINEIRTDKVIQQEGSTIYTYRDKIPVNRDFYDELEYIFLDENGIVDLSKLQIFLQDVIDYKNYQNHFSPRTSISIDSLSSQDIRNQVIDILNQFYSQSEIISQIDFGHIKVFEYEPSWDFSASIEIYQGSFIQVTKKWDIYDMQIYKDTFPIAQIAFNKKNNILHQGESHIIRELKKSLELYIKRQPNIFDIENDTNNLFSIFLQKSSTQLYYFMQMLSKKNTDVLDVAKSFKSSHHDDFITHKVAPKVDTLKYEKFNHGEFIDTIFDTKLTRIKWINNLSELDDILYHLHTVGHSEKTVAKLHRYTLSNKSQWDIGLERMTQFKTTIQQHTQTPESYKNFKIRENQKIIDDVLNGTSSSFLNGMYLHREKLLFIFQHANQRVKDSYKRRISDSIKKVKPALTNISDSNKTYLVKYLFSLIQDLHDIWISYWANNILNYIWEAATQNTNNIYWLDRIISGLLSNHQLIINACQDCDKYLVNKNILQNIFITVWMYYQDNIEFQAMKLSLENISGKQKWENELKKFIFSQLDDINMLDQSIQDDTKAYTQIQDNFKKLNSTLIALKTVSIDQEICNDLKDLVKILQSHKNSNDEKWHRVTRGEWKNKIIYNQRNINKYFSLLSKKYNLTYSIHDCVSLYDDVSQINIDFENIEDKEKFIELIEVQKEYNTYIWRNEKIEAMKKIIERIEFIIMQFERQQQASTKLSQSDKEFFIQSGISYQYIDRLKYTSQKTYISIYDYKNIFEEKWEDFFEIIENNIHKKELASFLLDQAIKDKFNNKNVDIIQNLDNFIGLLSFMNWDLSKFDENMFDKIIFNNKNSILKRLKVLVYLIDNNLLTQQVAEKYINNLADWIKFETTPTFKNNYYYFFKIYKNRKDFIGEIVNNIINKHKNVMKHFDEIYE